MSGCVLRVHGSGFDAKRFVAESGLKVLRPSESSFNVGVSCRSADDLPGQISDALRFMDSHVAVLVRLRSANGVEMTFDFCIAQKDVVGQFLRFPAELVRRAAEFGAGLEISVFAIQDS